MRALHCTSYTEKWSKSQQTLNTMKNLSDKEVANMRHKLSRIVRQVVLIGEGNTHTKDGISRMDVILNNAIDIDNDFLKG